MSSGNLLQGSSATGLFERLPDTLFRPLASQNRQLYWDLLVHLYEQFFGPDAPPAPEDGYLQRTVTIDVERFVSTREWLAAEGEIPEEDTPDGRARYILGTLIESGWLAQERIGVRTFLDMKPTVQKFFELLKQFAEEGPQFIGGKVQLIYNQLTAVLADPAEQAAGFHESAKAARALISILKATNMRVREAMDMLSTHESTADFVRAFFTDYIANLYIRDYHELRTDNHPLRHRYEILETVYALRDAAQTRDPLVRWYQHAFKTGTREQAEALFEKDVSRFLVFGQIEDYLDRLNNSVSRTTRRALSFIHYKIRTRDRLDRLLEQSFTAFEAAAALDVALEWPLAKGPLFSEGSLRDPKVTPAPVLRTPVRNPTMSMDMRIQNELRKQVTKNREVTPRELIRYIEAHVPAGHTRNSDTLPIDGVKGLCMHAALVRLTLASEVTPVTRHKYLAFLSELRKRGISLHRIAGEFTDNRWFTAPKFQVRR
jgi:Family of unknown function (DUF5716)